MAKLGRKKGVRFTVNGKVVSFVMNETIFSDGDNEYVENVHELMVLNEDNNSVRVRTADAVLNFLLEVMKDSDVDYVERTVSEMAYDYTKEDK